MVSIAVWVLVEWVDDKNLFPSYGVVNCNRFLYQESDLHPGKQIFIRSQNNDARRAKIIRISDSKRKLKEHKQFLEKQDKQMKNLLQMCMSTIKEIKSDKFSIGKSNSINTNGSHSGKPRMITANSESSTSDSDAEVPQKMYKMMTKFQTLRPNVRHDPKSAKKEMHSYIPNLGRHSIISSTPLPRKYIPRNIKLCFDQGTQTDSVWVDPQVEKIDELESVLRNLYGRFQSLVMQVDDAKVVENFMLLEAEQNDELTYAEANEWVNNNSNIITENITPGYTAGENNIPSDATAGPAAEAEKRTINVQNNNPVKVESINRDTNENTRVRRMPAQTTFTSEMVPIGSGCAVVPARLLSDICWSSHTTATRQLLQAIFPRKVLATHSLTGKPSPAHLNKPAKKLLNPNLVEDIITTVTSKCGVPKNLVRNSITVKCTDEAKLYRNRQQCKLSRAQEKQNDENIPPASVHSTDDSSHFNGL